MRRLLLLVCTLWLAACSEPARFNATDITGSDMGGDFALTDHTGKLRHLGDFRGKAVVIFFGYTQCPDICPTNMARLRDAMQRLGTDAQRVQVLFVTIDPERDTQQLLASYVPLFDPGFIGLYGDAATTAKVAKQFKVFYQKQKGSQPGSYTMDHSTGSYVFDPKGKLRLYVRNDDTPEKIAQDLKQLLGGA